jgi:hypothetical protein
LSPEYLPVHPWFWTKVYDLNFYRRTLKMCAKAARKAVQAVFARTNRRLADAFPEQKLTILYQCEADLEALVERHPEAAADWRRMEAFNDYLIRVALESGVTFTKNADGSYTVTPKMIGATPDARDLIGFGSLGHAAAD